MAAKTLSSAFTPFQFATILLTFFLFSSSIETTLADVVAPAKSSTKNYKMFIKTACNSTTYPTECYKSLSSYAPTIKTDSQRLSSTALSVTLRVARNVYKTISNLPKQKKLSSAETAIIKDCSEEIDDCIDELKQAMKEFKQLGKGDDVEFQMDNIKTWVSAALTDENTCTDEFEEQKVSPYVQTNIKKSIVKLSRHTSNALALINGLKY